MTATAAEEKMEQYASQAPESSGERKIHFEAWACGVKICEQAFTIGELVEMLDTAPHSPGEDSRT